MPAEEYIKWLLAAAFLAPLFSSAVVILLTRRVMFKAAGWFTFVVMTGAFICSVVAALRWIADKPGTIVVNVPWIPIHAPGVAYLYLGFMVDSLTIAMMVMVTGIAALVHLYSIGYMEGDKRYNRFFAYLSLFSFSMLGIVMANSIMMLFVFWELVGMTSYLLIGFWFEKRGPQLACKKAFVMNRIGDMGFLIGFGILFYHLGGKMLLPATGAGEPANMFVELARVLAAQGHSVTHPPMWLTAAGIGLFFGAIGKSAQFPLHTWLPDAMEGPTPVSSIVHSATMVAAGVYLTARIYPILTPGAHLFVSTIGLITLVMAACMALVMTDIKRVLAYSTLSQLGYMILGLGTGSYVFALYHLITHAFFKCCLFQCSGSVIHAAHHQQDMRYYGGLAKKMPVTALCYFICTLAIAGASIPFLKIGDYHVGMSGFYSKDGIIAGSINYGQSIAPLVPWGHLFFWGPTIIAFVTVFYMARSFALTFLGQPRDQHLYDNAHEAPMTMLIPQIVLAFMAIVSAPILPFFDLIASSTPNVAYIQPALDLAKGRYSYAVVEKMMEASFDKTDLYLWMGFGWIIMLAAGCALYIPGMKYSKRIAALPGVNLLYTWAHNKFYFDALYDVLAVSLVKFIAYVCAWVDKHLVDGLVNFVGLFVKDLADVTGLFDKRVVDGAVDGAAAFANHSADLLRTTQDGRVRVYVLSFFVSATLLTLLVVSVVLITR